MPKDGRQPGSRPVDWLMTRGRFGGSVFLRQVRVVYEVTRPARRGRLERYPSLHLESGSLLMLRADASLVQAVLCMLNDASDRSGAGSNGQQPAFGGRPSLCIRPVGIRPAPLGLRFGSSGQVKLHGRRSDRRGSRVSGFIQQLSGAYSSRCGPGVRRARA